MAPRGSWGTGTPQAKPSAARKPSASASSGPGGGGDARAPDRGSRDAQGVRPNSRAPTTPTSGPQPASVCPVWAAYEREHDADEGAPRPGGMFAPAPHHSTVRADDHPPREPSAGLEHVLPLIHI